MRLIRSRQAREDLLEIWQHVGRDSLAAADRLIDLFYGKFELLSKSPFLGAACPELAPGLRVFSVENYAIFYLLSESDVTIVRVLHGARDLASLFELPP